MIYEDFIKNKENVTLEMLIERITELESKLAEKPNDPAPEPPADLTKKYFEEVIK